MTRTTKGILALVTIAAVSMVGLAIAALNRGFSAKAEPLAIEAFVARHVRRLAIPAHARSAANPLPLTDDFVVDGMRHFADHCAVCHANDGSGDTDFGRNMYPKPPCRPSGREPRKARTIRGCSCASCDTCRS